MTAKIDLVRLRDAAHIRLQHGLMQEVNPYEVVALLDLLEVMRMGLSGVARGHRIVRLLNEGRYGRLDWHVETAEEILVTPETERARAALAKYAELTGQGDGA